MEKDKIIHLRVIFKRWFTYESSYDSYQIILHYWIIYIIV